MLEMTDEVVMIMPCTLSNSWPQVVH